MFAAAKTYFDELGAAVGAGWNRFWFTPTPATTLGFLRAAVGALAFYAIATYWPDLDRWFAPNGMMPLGMIRELYANQHSILDAVPANLLPAFFAATLVLLALFTVGVGGRAVCILAAIATISFFSRAPLVTGEFEAVLAFLLVYLCIGNAGDAFSLRTLIAKSPTPPPNPKSQTQNPKSLSPFNTISLRLIQLHIALVHLMTAFALLGVADGPWWSGEGIWLAASRPGMSLVDLSGLADHPRVVAAWSHAMLLYLLAMPVLVWFRLARPLLLAVGGLVWIAFAIASGWLMFSLAMLVGLAAFVEPTLLAAPQSAGK